MSRPAGISLLLGPILLGALLSAPPAGAGEPVSLFGGKLSLGGEMTGSYGTDDRGYFNYTDYGTNNLRLFRLDLAAELRLGGHVGAAADVRTDNLNAPRAYAAYLRLRPWTDRPLDIQAGQIPTVFGAFPRRRYLMDNPLIGTPLAYQYLTSMRPDYAPRNADELAARRGLGWLVPYPDADEPLAPGMPLVNVEHWDAGAQIRWGADPVQLAVSVTQGTLSDPHFHDNNSGKQVSGRVGWKPATGLSVGASAAVGPYFDRAVTDALPTAQAGRYDQKALGLDVEWSHGYWIVRGEAVFNAWEVPVLEEPVIDSPLRALGLMLETRYKILPGFYVAARLDRLTFSSIETSHGSLPWDAPVTRVEAGLGYSIHRYVLAKAVYQYNHRDGGLTRHEMSLVAGQILVWF